ncbi:hypothetical protein Q4603_18610 [Zobellia galactanivorans]|uniref:hypothetical protein n=1 Tax=Zobellia galactanivorans (strain DSM 12802 / CCUG 47099 / CIP 106680 / NCIMB 13871 / Dsij) TaxID=63186 RepID=UPI0026E3F8ED|nr:hypothetical protein [Zobellia galactanivorans]MDO6810642.1 hypothetical protein [Zobellia galactanivorans]
MIKLTHLFFLFFSVLSFAQEKLISESDLVGYWTFEEIIKENDTNITIYKRCNVGKRCSNTRKINTTIRFMPNGEYRISHSLGRGYGRCGNVNRPKNVVGYYKMDPELQKITLESYDTDPIKNWEIVWIDEISLGVKKN